MLPERDERLPAGQGQGAAPEPWCVWLMLFSIAALIAVLAARLLGPSDLWDQTQPKTIAYTADMLAHGGNHWVLPVERGEHPATKPPLYNWLAAPGVKALGFDSEFAHKLPSVFAFIVCWIITIRLGARFDPRLGRSIGWLAGLMFATNYASFKLSYLARPDMLLTLWTLVAWYASTVVYMRACERAHGVSSSSQRGWVVTFWLAFALATLTKGPAALVLLAYVVAAARVVGGSWKMITAIRPLEGCLLSLLIAGPWLYGVWLIDPQHVEQELWYNEFIGRVTGLGPEGPAEGPIAWVTGLLDYPFYFLTRFAPWSLCAIVAMWIIRRSAVRWREFNERAQAAFEPPGGGSVEPRHSHDAGSMWRHAAALQVLLIIGVFTLSAGKRADYISDAYPQASLLAAWVILARVRARRWRLPHLAPLAAAITLAVMIAANEHDGIAPTPRFGNHILRFAQQANQIIDAPEHTGMDVYFFQTGPLHLQALMGQSEKEDLETVRGAVQNMKPFWLVCGPSLASGMESNGRRWLRNRAEFELVLQSQELPRTDKWVGQVSLFRVTPHVAASPDD